METKCSDNSLSILDSSILIFNSKSIKILSLRIENLQKLLNLLDLEFLRLF
jgi:hypothetical protein